MRPTSAASSRSSTAVGTSHPGAGDRLDGVDRGAAAERTQDAEHRPRRLVEQPDAPVDRGPEGPLALGAVPGAAGEQGEHVVEAGGRPLGPERSDACGSQLERERDPVDRTTDAGDRRGVRVGQREGGIGGARPLDVEPRGRSALDRLDGRRVEGWKRERWHRVRPLGADP